MKGALQAEGMVESSPRSFRCLRPIAIALLLSIEGSAAADPSWWPAPVGPVDNYAVANIGQLKNMAAKARQHLESTSPAWGGFYGGAGPEIDFLFDNPEPRRSSNDPPQGWDIMPVVRPENEQMLLVGQLKHIASLFYDRLIEQGYAVAYPWTTTPSDDNNFGPANIGQLKNLFSFDLHADTDADGLPDMWELTRSGSLNHSVEPGDSDGDGLPDNLELSGLGSDPLSSDSDRDGFPDPYENTMGNLLTDPYDAPDPVFEIAVVQRTVAYEFTSDGNGSAGQLDLYSDWSTGEHQALGVPPDNLGPYSPGQIMGILDGTPSLAFPTEAPPPESSEWESPSFPIYVSTSHSAFRWETAAPDQFENIVYTQSRIWIKEYPVSTTPRYRTLLVDTSLFSGTLPQGSQVPLGPALVDFFLPAASAVSNFFDFAPSILPALTEPMTLNVQTKLSSDPVIFINQTRWIDDNFVAVSAGSDDDLASELKIVIGSEGAGFTGVLSVENSAGDDGDIKFKATNAEGTSTDVDFGANGVATTLMWGTKPSSGELKTTISIKLKDAQGAEVKDAQGNPVVLTQKVTVFEGVKIEFAGTFYSPVDTRNFFFRISDGLTKAPGGPFAGQIPPKWRPGFENAPWWDDAVDEDTGDVSSALVFRDEDGYDLTLPIPDYAPVVRREWSPVPVVNISKISAISPKVEIKKRNEHPTSPTEIGVLSTPRAHFREGTGEVPKKLLHPEIVLLTKSGKEIVKLVAEDTRYFSRANRPKVDPSLTVAQYKNAILAAVAAGQADKLIEWQYVRFLATTLDQNGNIVEGTAAAKDLALTQLADFFFARAKDWGEVGVPGDEVGPAEVPLEFDLEKGEDLNFSFSTTERAALGIAAKGLLGWEETHGGRRP